MEQSDLRQLLREMRFSSPLSDATSAKLAGLVSYVEIPARTIIFGENIENFRLYLLVEGEVALEMCVPARGCTRILTLGPGDLLAWSSLLGDGRMTAGAQALTDTKMLVADAQAVNDLCAADHDFGYEFFRGVAISLSRRLVATRLQLLDLYGEAPAAGTFAWRD